MLKRQLTYNTIACLTCLNWAGLAIGRLTVSFLKSLFKSPLLYFAFAAGMEKTPMSRSSESQGRIVFQYEPVVGTFVSHPSILFLIKSIRSHQIKHTMATNLLAYYSKKKEKQPNLSSVHIGSQSLKTEIPILHLTFSHFSAVFKVAGRGHAHRLLQGCC